MHSLLFQILMFNTPSASPLPEMRRTLSVSGTAEISVIPDQALISFTIEDRGVDLQEAQKENSQTVKAFTKYITKELNIDPKLIQTNHIEVQPEYQYCNYNDDPSCDPLTVRFYSVVQQLQVQLQDLDKYEPLLNQAFEVGISQINHVHFQSSTLQSHKEEARKKAALAAKAKADSLAQTLGVTVLKPISIQLDVAPQSPYIEYNTRSMESKAVLFQSAGGTQGIAAGQLSINATVNVVFEIE